MDLVVKNQVLEARTVPVEDTVVLRTRVHAAVEVKVVRVIVGIEDRVADTKSAAIAAVAHLVVILLVVIRKVDAVQREPVAAHRVEDLLPVTGQVEDSAEALADLPSAVDHHLVALDVAAKAVVDPADRVAIAAADAHQAEVAKRPK